MRCAVFLLFCLYPSLALTDSIDQSLAYIECFDEAGKIISKGSGVIVSSKGHVLTARHVVRPARPKDPEDNRTECRASVAIADSRRTEILVVPDVGRNEFDAVVAQINSNNTFPPMKFCIFDDTAARIPIIISGFPGGTNTGKPSFRRGIVSTVFISPNGTVETDVISAPGMSGGPVVKEDGSELVGIISGAKYSRIGDVEHYAITPVSKFAHYFPQLIGSEQSCSKEKGELESTSTEMLAGLEDEISKLKEEVAGLRKKLDIVKNPLASNKEVLSQNLFPTCWGKFDDDRSKAGTGIFLSGGGFFLFPPRHNLCDSVKLPKGRSVYTAYLKGRRDDFKIYEMRQDHRGNDGIENLSFPELRFTSIGSIFANKDLKFGDPLVVVGYKFYLSEKGSIPFSNLSEERPPEVTARHATLMSSRLADDGTFTILFPKFVGAQGALVATPDGRIIGIVSSTYMKPMSYKAEEIYFETSRVQSIESIAKQLYPFIRVDQQ